MHPERPTLSICLITKNEEAFLERCLKAARPHCEELIVVDTGSTDATLKIAKKYADKIESFEWCDDFAKARNHAASFASKDWVLSLDADEVLTSAAFENIHQTLLHSEDEGYRILVYNYSHEKYWQSTSDLMERIPESDEFPGFHATYNPKLYRNGLGIEWEGNIHETFLPNLRAKGFSHSDIKDVVIHHIGGSRKKHNIAQKKQYYLKLLLEKVKQEPKNHRAWLELGVSMTDNELYQQALHCYQKAIELKPDWLEPRRNMGSIFLHLGQFKKAEQFFRYLTAKEPKVLDHLTQLSTCLLYQKRFKECLAVINKCLHVNEQNAILHMNAGIAYHELSSLDESIEHFEKAYAINPRNEFVEKALKALKAAV